MGDAIPMRAPMMPMAKGNNAEMAPAMAPMAGAPAPAPPPPMGDAPV
jgi:hypothetical protein